MSITGVFLPLAGERALKGLSPQIWVIAASRNDSHGCERRGRNGPNEHKKELAGAPQNDGTVERLGPIGSLHSGLVELNAKPSAAQW